MNEIRLHLTTLLSVLCSAMVLLPAMTDAQDSDRNSRKKSKRVVQFLERLDQNKNGILDPSEVSGRTKEYIKSIGMDPEKPLRIDYVAKAIGGKDKKDDKSTSSRTGRIDSSSVTRKVPGFGVEIKRVGVPDFTGTTPMLTHEAVANKFGDDIAEQVKRSLDRYDKNQNGVLDPEEVTKARWGSPSPKESDLNNDGKLTRAELAQRYADRIDGSRDRGEGSKSDRGSTSRRSSSRSKSKKNSSDVASGLKERMQKYETKLKSSSNAKKRIEELRARKKERETSKRREPEAFNSGSDRFARYADGLMRSYDKNKNGSLDKEEVKKMRNPPAGADGDGDGTITRAELITALSGNGSDDSSSTSKTSTRSKSSSRSRGSRSRGSRSTSFSGLDLNQDGQIQMSEYAEKWTEKLVAEFRKKDLNGDGVVTQREWQGRRD